MLRFFSGVANTQLFTEFRQLNNVTFFDTPIWVHMLMLDWTGAFSLILVYFAYLICWVPLYIETNLYITKN